VHQFKLLSDESPVVICDPYFVDVSADSRTMLEVPAGLHRLDITWMVGKVPPQRLAQARITFGEDRPAYWQEGPSVAVDSGLICIAADVRAATLSDEELQRIADEGNAFARGTQRRWVLPSGLGDGRVAVRHDSRP